LLWKFAPPSRPPFPREVPFPAVTNWRCLQKNMSIYVAKRTGLVKDQWSTNHGVLSRYESSKYHRKTFITCVLCPHCFAMAWHWCSRVYSV
jgi:hypothetical protein